MIRMLTWEILALILFIVCVVQLCLLYHKTAGDHASYSRFPTSNHLKYLYSKKEGSDIVTAYHERFHEAGTTHKQLNTRVAILVPYVGKALPAWFDMFSETASASAGMFDWLIFVTEVPLRETPSNVYLIKISKDELFSRFARIETDTPSQNHIVLKEGIKILFTKQPYVFVEFKPCLGHIFSDFIKNYSHWAYADIDQLLGRMPILIDNEKLSKYDIYTSSFGDNYRMYMRGQLTIHKNNPFVNNLWRSCVHLSKLHRRLSDFIDSGYKNWHFESAEGCYSKVVADHANLTVLVGNTQLTDAFAAPLDQKESILLGSSLIRCYQRPVDFSDGQQVSAWRDGSVHRASETTSALFLRRLQYRCAYWVDPKFEVCVDYLPADADMEINSGKISYYPGARYHVLGGYCREATVSHFQGWKSIYYTFTTRLPPVNSNALVITENGFIPLKIPSSLGLLPPLLQAADTMPPLGRITPQEVADMGAVAEHDIVYLGGHRGRAIPRLLGQEQQQQQQSRFTITDEGMNRYHSNEAISTTTVIDIHTGRSGTIDEGEGEIGEGSSQSRTRPGGDGYATAYCGAFSEDVKKCVCPILGSHIEVIQARPSSSSSSSYERGGQGATAEVTLITVAWASEFYSGQMQEMLSHWKGPKHESPLHVARFSSFSSFSNSCQPPFQLPTESNPSHQIVVLARTDAELELRSKAPHDDVTILEVNLAACLTLNNKPSSSSSTLFLPDNLLFNVGMDASSTDLVCLLPAGFIVSSSISADMEEIQHERAQGNNEQHQEHEDTEANNTRYGWNAAQSHRVYSELRDEIRTTELQLGKPVALVLSSFSSQMSDEKPVLSSSIESMGPLGPYPLPGSPCGLQQSTSLMQRTAVDPSARRGTNRSVGSKAAHRDLLSVAVQQIDPPADTSSSRSSTTTISHLSLSGQETLGNMQRLLAQKPGTGGDIHELPLSPSYTPLAARSDPSMVKFNAVDFTKHQTMMLPVLFNVTASPHGSGFVRFPDELSGPGCFGTTLLRILAGSGYKLAWSKTTVAYVSESEETPSAARANQEACGCLHGGDPNSLRQMVGRLNAYYNRAVQLRESGIQSVFSSEKFGVNFEAEQAALLKERGL